MKLHLFINKKPMNGYLNLSPLGNDQEVQITNFLDFNKFVDDGECTEIIADDVIDYLPANQLSLFLTAILNKMRIGSTIVLGGVDLFEVSRQMFMGYITVSEMNTILHGDQQTAWGFKYSALTLSEVANILSHLGLKITKKKLTGYNYIIEAMREGNV